MGVELNVLSAIRNRAKIKISLLAVALTTAMLIGGCLPSDPLIHGATAVKLSNGDIVARVRACGEPRLVSAVELHLARDVDIVLWRVDSPSGSPLDRFTIGATPAEFVESTALLEQPQAGTRYFLNAEEPKRVLHVRGVTFDPADLETDVWLVGRPGGNKKLTDEEFDRLDPC